MPKLARVYHEGDMISAALLFPEINALMRSNGADPRDTFLIMRLCTPSY